jgi:hypothetical protein
MTTGKDETDVNQLADSLPRSGFALERDVMPEREVEFPFPYCYSAFYSYEFGEIVRLDRFCVER